MVIAINGGVNSVSITISFNIVKIQREKNLYDVNHDNYHYLIEHIDSRISVVTIPKL